MATAKEKEAAGRGVVFAAVLGAVILAGVLLLSAASTMGLVKACSVKTVERTAFTDGSTSVPTATTVIEPPETVPLQTNPASNSTTPGPVEPARTVEREEVCSGVGMQSAVVVLGGLLGGTLLLPMLVRLMPDGAEGALAFARLKGRSPDANVRGLVEETLSAKQAYDDRDGDKTRLAPTARPRGRRKLGLRRRPRD